MYTCGLGQKRGSFARAEGRGTKVVFRGGGREAAGSVRRDVTAGSSQLAVTTMTLTVLWVSITTVYSSEHGTRQCTNYTCKQ